MRRLVAFAASLFGAVALCRCAASVPPPKPVLVQIGDADVPLALRACSNGYTFCPSSFPDGGLNVCVALVNARYGLTPATMPTVLMCEAQAADKPTFFACGGVSSCP